MDDRDDDNDPIDVLLHERLGHRRPPDLSAAVMDRLLRGDAPRAAGRLRWQPSAAAPAWRQRLLAAAVVLGGLGTVAGAVLLREDPAKAASPQEPQRPEPLRVPTPPAPQDPTRTAAPVQLRVVDLHGGPVQSFELDVVASRHDPAPRYAKIEAWKPRRLEPRDFAGEYAALDGLPDGTYVAIVTADAHARTLSEPFVIADGKGPQVTVKLNLGGEVSGVVLGSDGKPLAGAAVRIDEPPLKGMDASPLAEVFARMLPHVLQPQSTVTGANGEYRLRRLCYGNYALFVDHPDYCRTTVDSVPVTAEPLRLDPVLLATGAHIRGTVAANGKGRSGVLVTLQRLADDGKPLEKGPRWTAVSGEDGAFEMQLRVPPGRYSVGGMDEKAQNPFDKILQLKASTRTFEVRPADRDLVQDVELGGS